MRNKDVLCAHRKSQISIRDEAVVLSSGVFDRFYFYKTKALPPLPHLRNHLFKKNLIFKILFFFAFTCNTHAPNLEKATTPFQANVCRCMLSASKDLFYTETQLLIDMTWPSLNIDSEFLTESQRNIIRQNFGLCQKLLDLKLIRILDANKNEVTEPSTLIILQASIHNFLDNMQYLLTQFATAIIPQESKQIADSCLAACQKLLPNIQYQCEFTPIANEKSNTKQKQSYIGYITTASTLSLTKAFIHLLSDQLRLAIKAKNIIKVISSQSQTVRQKLFVEDIKITMALTTNIAIKTMCEILIEKISAEIKEEEQQPTARQGIFNAYLNSLLENISKNGQYESHQLAQSLANKVLVHILIINIHFFESENNPKHQARNLIGSFSENKYIHSMDCITFPLSLNYFAQLIRDATTFDIEEEVLLTEDKLATLQPKTKNSHDEANEETHVRDHSNVLAWLEALHKFYNTQDLEQFIKTNHTNPKLFDNCTLEDDIAYEIAQTETSNLTSDTMNRQASDTSSPTPGCNSPLTPRGKANETPATASD